MKLLSVTVPCYNSQDYMRHCVETLLPGGDEVEILIVDDGSKDDTAAIADQLQAQYPTIVRAIHQENAGHGGAVMKGLENATGLYFKVVDSDDWVSDTAYREILDKLTELTGGEEVLDMIIANDVSQKGAGFDGDTNIITSIVRGETEDTLRSWPLMSKKQAAEQIIELITGLPRFPYIGSQKEEKQK